MRDRWKAFSDLRSPIAALGVPPEGLGDRLARAVGWHTVGTVFNQGSTFLVNIVLARLLAQHAFGQYAMIQTTLVVVASMAQLASGYTATKYLAEYRDRQPDRAGRVLALCAIVSVVMAVVAAAGLLGGARWLATATLQEPGLAPGLMLAAGVVLFSVLNGFLIGALAGLERYRALGKAGIASGTAYIAFCALGAWAGGIHGALTGAAASGLLQSLILGALLARHAAALGIAARWSSAWDERAILWRFSIPAALNGFVSLPAIWVASALLVRQPQGFEQFALFSAANNFRIMVLFLPGVVNSVGMSVLNNQRGAGEEAQFRRLFWANVGFTVAIVLAGGVTVAVFGRWLLALFGPGFQDAHPVLLLLMGAALAESLALAAFQSIQSHGRLWISFIWAAVPGYTALVTVAAFLSDDFGAVGLGWAYVACWMTGLVANWLLVWRLGVWSSPARSNPV